VKELAGKDEGRKGERLEERLTELLMVLGVLSGYEIVKKVK
jgi:hypothetical protein